jgi:hypothetical protein
MSSHKPSRDISTRLVMSVPERARCRNSTMFVGTPPSGYGGTDDRRPDISSSWHPPRTPPHDTAYREHVCIHPELGPDTHIRSRSRGKSPSLELDVPDMKLSDVVPALFSSPELSPHLVQHSDDLPNIGQLIVQDNQQSPRPRASVSSTLEDSFRGLISLRVTHHTQPLTYTTQKLDLETVCSFYHFSPSS